MVDGKIQVSNRYMDDLCVRGVRVVRDDTSPKVILEAYPPVESGRIFGDPGVVSAKVALWQP
jgi:hypothetical protein